MRKRCRGRLSGPMPFPAGLPHACEGLQVYTRQEVSGILKVSLRTVDNLILGNRIGHFRVGRSVRVTRRHLEEFCRGEGANV